MFNSINNHEEEQISIYRIDIQTLVCLNVFDTFSFTNNSFPPIPLREKSKSHCSKSSVIRYRIDRSVIDKQCLSFEPEQCLYFNHSTLSANLTLTNQCSDRIVQFQLMCTRNNGLSVWPNAGRIDPKRSVQCLFTLQSKRFQYSSNVLLLDEQDFSPKRTSSSRSLQFKPPVTDDLHLQLSQFQVYVQWHCITSTYPIRSYYHKLYCFVIAKRSSSAELSSIDSNYSIPYGISLLIALMFGYLFGRWSVLII